MVVGGCGLQEEKCDSRNSDVPPSPGAAEKSHKKDDPFQVLGARQGLGLAELRRLYQAEALKTHPDKPGGSTEAFQRVQRAWEAVSDVSQSHGEAAAAQAAEQVDLAEMKPHLRQECWQYEWKCRCGDSVIVFEEQLAEGIDTFECSSCSLKVHVLFQEVGESE